MDNLIKLISPLITLAGFGPVDQPQIMDDVAAADDQHASLTQRRKRLANPVVNFGRRRAVDAELKNRHIAIWIHMMEY